MELKTIYIEVKVYGGLDIVDALTDMIAMARHLRCGVWAEINGIHTLARPSDQVSELLEFYNQAQENHMSHAATGPD